MDVGELRHDDNGKGCNTRIDAAVRKVAGQRSRTAYKYFPGSRRVRSSVESALNGNAKGVWGSRSQSPVLSSSFTLLVRTR
jgi:hypothetical protein